MNRPNERSRRYGLGKVDYYGTGKRVNPVVIELRLWDDEKGRPVFAAVGEVLNGRGNVIVCGQCMDDPVFDEVPGESKALCDELRSLWRKWHCNDGKAGTPAQYECLERMPESFVKDREAEWKKEHPYGSFCRYDAELKRLEKEGMLEDERDSEKVRYGEQFVYWPIDPKDLERIRELVDGKK